MFNTTTIEPLFENAESVRDFLELHLKKLNIETSLRIKLYIALDEILSNIIKFSKASFVTVGFKKSEDMIYLKFTDDGIFFDPVSSDGVDINLPLDERDEGGLGIFMVKNSMNYINYEYVNKKNILTLGLKINV